MSSAPPIVTSPTRSPWFRSARFDLLLILCTPLLTWPLITMARLEWGHEILLKLIVVTATGHYMATFVRAYGDIDLFKRYKTRFLLSPIVMFATCIGLFTTGYGPQLTVLVAAWGFWHWLAQAFGFARIYDIKVGSYKPLTAWLDKALVITGFIGTATLCDGALVMFGNLFLDAGIHLPSAETRAIMQTTVMTLVIAVGIAYTLNLVVTIAKGQPWSWQKQLMHVMTIGYYWFAFSYLPNVLIAYVLYEFFHDIQYYAITWITCQKRVERPGVARWLKWMFQPKWAMAIVFVAAMTLFGGLDAIGRFSLSNDDLNRNIWLGAFIAIALLHYYYDGFIWKARESSLGSDLGIKGGKAARAVPSIKHGLSWALFFIPLGLLINVGNQDINARERVEEIAAFAPEDFESQGQLAMQKAQEGDFLAALESYHKSVTLNPDYAPTHLNYGAVLELKDQLEEAKAQYELALACEDSNNTHTATHLYLGCLLQVLDQPELAASHLDESKKGEANNPIARLLSMSNAMPVGANDRRLRYCSAANQLAPEDFHVRLMMGQILVDSGRHRDALPHLQFILDQGNRYIPALIPMAIAQVELGMKSQARRTISLLLQTDPSNAIGNKLKSRIGGF